MPAASCAVLEKAQTRRAAAPTSAEVGAVAVWTIDANALKG
jgi:hypothetical protein